MAKKADVNSDIVSESITITDGPLIYVDFAAFGGPDAINHSCFGAFACLTGDPATCPDWLPVHDWAVDNLEYDDYLNCQAQLQQLQQDLSCVEPRPLQKRIRTTPGAIARRFLLTPTPATHSRQR
jgi:hypothetical protein